MKKIVRITVFMLGLTLVILFVAPFLFQDQIKEALQSQIDEALEAEIYFGDVSLNFFRNFPDVSVQVEDYGIVGEDVFAEDTLISGKQLRLSLDLGSVLFGDSYQLHEIRLSEPRINVVVLADGTANYDIAPSDTTATLVEEDTTSSSFQLDLKSYRIEDAYVRYLDESYPMEAIIKGLTHSGSGNFTDVVYTLQTTTMAEDVSVTYDGVQYLDHGTVSGEVNTQVDMTQDLHITLQENEIKVNELPLQLDGVIDMPGDDIIMDLSYAAPNTDFRGLFSVIPGVYKADFADIQTKGDLTFDGTVKGTYNDERMPGFTLNLTVANGQVQYPALPQSIDQIGLQLGIQSPDNDLDAMEIQVPSFHADLGDNPLDGRVLIQRLDRMQIDGNLKGKLNLADVTKFYPIEGTELKGIFDLDASAKGVYDEKAGTFPLVDARMKLEEGFVRNADYPATISDLHFHATLEDADEQLSSAVFDMPDFHFLLDEEPIDGSLQVSQFDNPHYKLTARGKLDLAKLLQIYPMEGVDISGIVQVQDFQTVGTYEDIEAENYTQLPTSGSVSVQNIRYLDSEMPGPITVDAGTVSFNNDRLNIQQASGKLSQSDYAFTGYVTNYLAYALLPDQPLGGALSLKANSLNLNEWMEETDAEEPTSEAEGESTDMAVIPVPAGIDLSLTTDIQQLLYDDLIVKEVEGALAVRNQQVDLQGLNFDLFGGSVLMTGSYGTQNIRKPTYLFDLIVEELNIGQMLQQLPWVGQFAPALEAINGICNTEVALAGYLTQHMHPVLEEIDGAGIFEIIKGTFTSSPMFSAIASKTKLQDLVPFDIDDIRGSFKMEDGQLFVAPLDLEVGQLVLTLSGKQSLDGKIDYTLEIDAPSGELGQAALASLSDMTGFGLTASDRVQVNLGIGGTTTKPSISAAGGGSGSQIKDQLTDAAEDQLGQALNTDVSLQKDSLAQKAKDVQQAAQDSAQALIDQVKQAAKDSIDALTQKAKDEAKNQADDMIGDAIGEDAKQKLDELKKKLPFGKKKKNK